VNGVVAAMAILLACLETSANPASSALHRQAGEFRDDAVPPALGNRQDHPPGDGGLGRCPGIGGLWPPIPGLGASGVACLPGCVPPQAARPVAMAAASASRVISSVLMLPACAAHAGSQRPSVPFRAADGHVLPSWGGFVPGVRGLKALPGTPEDAIGLVTLAC